MVGSMIRARLFLIDATSLGADDLAGTADDGQIREIEVYLNGTLQGSLSSGILTSGSRYEFYQFNIPSDQPAGEYLLEAIAEDRAGLRSRASASIVIRGSVDVNMTGPELGETLYWDQIVDFTYSADTNVTSYLEVDGMDSLEGQARF